MHASQIVFPTEREMGITSQKAGLVITLAARSISVGRAIIRRTTIIGNTGFRKAWYRKEAMGSSMLAA